MPITRAYASAAQPGNAFLAGKNKIINGDFGIWQRGTSFSGNSFTADRWYIDSDATLTTSQQTFTPGAAPVAGYEGAFFIRYAKSAGGTYMAPRQRIEDVRTFAGQTVTMSFWAKADATVTIAPYYQQVFGTGGSTTVGAQIATQSITTSWVRYSFTVTLPSISGKTIGTGSYLEMYTARYVGSAATTIDVWGVQVEAGNVATAFQTATGTLAGELAACQRYYEKSFDIATAPANGLGSTAYSGGISGWIAYDANNVRSLPIIFKVTKRSSPTITIYNSNDIADAGKWAYYTGSAFANASVTAQTVSNNTQTGFYVTGRNDGAYTQHRPYLLAGQWAAEAEL